MKLIPKKSNLSTIMAKDCYIRIKLSCIAKIATEPCNIDLTKTLYWLIVHWVWKRFILAVSNLWLNTKGNSMKKYVLALFVFKMFLCLFNSIFILFSIFVMGLWIAKNNKLQQNISDFICPACLCDFISENFALSQFDWVSLEISLDHTTLKHSLEVISWRSFFI